MKGGRKCQWEEGGRISPWDNDDDALQALSYFSELPERKYICTHEESQRTCPTFRGARSVATSSNTPTSGHCRGSLSENH